MNKKRLFLIIILLAFLVASIVTNNNTVNYDEIGVAIPYDETFTHKPHMVETTEHH